MDDESDLAMKPTTSEQAVFAEALQRDTPEARAAYLDAACGTDAALRQHVEALLWCVLLDLVTDSVRITEMPQTMVAFVALNPDAERLATSGWHSKHVKLWDGHSGTLIREWEVGSSARVYFTPDNRQMIVARAKEFTFHDLNSLEVSRRMPRENGLFPGHVAFSADGQLMAMEMAPGLIHLHEVTSGRTVAKLADPNGDQSAWMSFSPDGTQLVVAAMLVGAIHRWDLRAIRARLKTMNLDWDWPEFPAPPPPEVSLSQSQRPLRVQVVDKTSPDARQVSPAKP